MSHGTALGVPCADLVGYSAPTKRVLMGLVQWREPEPAGEIAEPVPLSRDAQARGARAAASPGESLVSSELPLPITALGLSISA